MTKHFALATVPLRLPGLRIGFSMPVFRNLRSDRNSSFAIMRVHFARVDVAIGVQACLTTFILLDVSWTGVCHSHGMIAVGICV